MLASPECIRPVSVLVAPLLLTLSPEIHIKTHTLRELVHGAPRLALFCCASQSACIIEDVPKNDLDDVLALTAGLAGGHFIVSALDFLGGENTSWDIAILTPHIPSSVSVHSLPTPPASPALRPVTQVSFPRSSASAPLHASTSIPHTEPTTAASAAASEDEIPLPAGPPTRVQTAQSSLQRSLISFVKHNVVFALVTLRSLFGVLFSSLRGRRGVGVHKTATPPDAPASQRIGTLDLAGTSDPHIESPELGASLGGHEALCQGTRLDASRELQPFVFNTLVGGQVSMILRNRSANTTLTDVVVECDGNVINDLKVKEIGNDVYLVDFHGGAQGRISVSLP